MNKLTCILICCLWGWLSVRAQSSSPLTFTRIGLQEGLSQNTVLDIRYMCTYVHRFNYEWNTYHNDELEVPSQLSHDLFVNCTFGKRQEFTVAAECTNLSDERLYDNFKMQKPGRAFALKVAYRFTK